jgi:hypothetical protein
VFRHLVTGMDGCGAERTCFPDETRHGGTEHSCDKRQALSLVLYLTYVVGTQQLSAQVSPARPSQAKHNTAPRSSIVADCRRTRSQYQLACHGPGALWVCQCLIGSSATHPPPDVLWWSTTDPESHAPSAGQQKPGSLQGRPARPGGEAIGGARIALAGGTGSASTGPGSSGGDRWQPACVSVVRPGEPVPRGVFCAAARKAYIDGLLELLSSMIVERPQIPGERVGSDPEVQLWVAPWSLLF